MKMEIRARKRITVGLLVLACWLQQSSMVVTCAEAQRGAQEDASLKAVQTPAPAEQGKLPVWLVRDGSATSAELPKNFRKMHDSSSPGKGNSLGTGLEKLNASGSAQFSRPHLKAIKKACSGYKLTVVDLRQESHGIINGEIPVSWFQGKNQVNWGKGSSEILADESSRLSSLRKSGIGRMHKLAKPERDPNGLKKSVESHEFSVSSALAESELCDSLGVSYVRIPVPDYQSPAPEYVDKFVEMTESLDENDWLHFHCRAGQGRTTTFLTMYDMMHNADTVPFETILRRQRQLGGADLLDLDAEPDWKLPYKKARLDFVRKFYDYCQDQIPKKFAVPFSKFEG